MSDGYENSIETGADFDDPVEPEIPGVNNFDEEALEEEEEDGFLKLREDIDLVKKMEELDKKERSYLERREAFNEEYASYVDEGVEEVEGLTLEQWKVEKERELMEEYKLIQEEKAAAFKAHEFLDRN